MLFNTIFYRFLVVLTVQNEPRIQLFSIFFEHVDLVKILTKHWLCARKSRFGLEKKEEKIAKHRFQHALEKNTAENFSKFDFGFHLDPPNPSKITAERQPARPKA